MDMITYESIAPTEDCAKAVKKKSVIEDGYNHDELIKNIDEIIMQHRNEGTSLDGNISTACENRGQVKHSSYETHMQKIKLKV